MLRMTRAGGAGAARQKREGKRGGLLPCGRRGERYQIGVELGLSPHQEEGGGGVVALKDGEEDAELG